jgi:hypothetical protein
MEVYESKYTRTQLDEGIGAGYVPTLQAAPTSYTISYTRSDLPSGSQTVSFVVGQMCRVAVTGGYDFYQLKDVTGGTATWEKVEYGGTIPANVAYFSNDSGEGVVPSDGIRAETVNAGASISVNPDVVTVVSGNVGTATITLQVPSDNLAHVWDILMTTGSSVNVTFATSTSATIKKPSGFAVGASKSCEVSVIGVGTTYYLRYGEFA